MMNKKQYYASDEQFKKKIDYEEYAKDMKKKMKDPLKYTEPKGTEPK